jgi:hypothetical protein
VTIAAGPFAIAAVLLVLGGAAKTLRPDDTARALREAGLRIPSMGVRLVAVAELLIGGYAIVVGDRASAVLVALSYAAFIGFVVVALGRRLPISTCGCFGRTDTPPSLVHVGIDLGAVVAAAVVAVDPGVGLLDVVGDQPVAGVPYVILVATGVLCALVAMTALPKTLALAREGSPA